MIQTAKHPAIDRLLSVVGQGGILFDPDELRVYECDGFSIAKGSPLAVVFPVNTQQVSDCVKVLSEYDLQIVPRGSGTGLAGGAVVYSEGVLISTTRMTCIEKVDIANRYAIVQSGVRNLALSDAIASTGWRFSPDPSSQRASTIGGNVANNAGGINTLKNGVTSNHILGIEMVMPDGRILQTRSGGLYDGFGADLPGLICASEGTFGIITRVWCRLVLNPTNIRTVMAIYDSIQNACHTVADVIAKGIVPTSMEMMDGTMIQILEDAFHFGFDTSAKAVLLLEIDGVEEILDQQMEAILQLARDNHATDIQLCADPKRRAELWKARKSAFGAIGRVARSYCTQDACVPRSKLPDVMAKVAELGEKYGIRITNVFHAGDGNIHPIMMFDEDDPQETQRTLQLGKEILEYCVDVGGTITGEHGIGVEKLPLMAKMFNTDTLDAFLEIKKTFDPDQRVNDSKNIPSDKLMIEIFKPVAINVPGGAL
jgi:glycolate oxidase